MRQFFKDIALKVPPIKRLKEHRDALFGSAQQNELRIQDLTARNDALAREIENYKAAFRLLYGEGQDDPASSARFPMVALCHPTRL